GNVCTIASGNACKAATANTEVPSPGGAFSVWPEGFGNFSEFGEEVAVDSVGNVYVGDVRQIGGFGSNQPVPPSRIQKFGPGGEFLGQVVIPGENPTSDNYNRPWSIGVDSTGRIFSAEYGARAIEIFQQSQLGLEETGPTFAERDAFALKERSWHL